MKNSDISAIFRAIGELLQIRGDDAFRARIYERAADIIDSLPRELAEMHTLEEFRARPGIGKAIEDKTVEMIETGRCKVYDELTAEMGTEVLDLLKIRGIGVKTASRFYYELGIRNLDDLGEALESGQLRRMKGIGKRTLKLIAESLKFHAEQQGTRPLREALKIAERVADMLKNAGIQRHEFTGGLRRREEICRGLDCVVQANGEIGNIRQSLLARLGENASVSDEDSNQIQFRVERDFPVTLHLCTAAEYEATRFRTTATEEHLTALQTLPYPPDSERNGEFLYPPTADTEESIYEKMGLSYIPSELRGSAESITAAAEGTLPRLVAFSDLRGDLHAHTDWSDGRNTLRDMIEAAKAAGFEYIAITDHSVSSSIANGLDRGRLLHQIEQIRELDAEIEGIAVLAGSEVDIREYGYLDFPEGILEKLDIVVASVHSHFTLSEERMTRRIVRAIENPFVHIIGHPTGRLLGKRPMYALNLEEIIAAAAENGTVLEINGSPSRLDLGPEFVHQAKRAGVQLAVNTDAHAISHLENRHFGINVARRGWLTKGDVINTYTLEELNAAFGIGRGLFSDGR